ncbi:ultraviolet-B receptor UVR8 [Acrasis kona]|uniref:Ultraviolet-B receptor UVR8 n=1 Tax=Acrasis kona TaxID=1008807 RepID=A0AAW2ZD39_9EUKA
MGTSTSKSIEDDIIQEDVDEQSDNTEGRYNEIIPYPVLGPGCIITWGRNSEGNTGRVQEENDERTFLMNPDFLQFESRKVKQVSAKAWHTVLLTEDGCYGFGWNQHANLGLGMKSRKISTVTKIPSTENVIQIATGEGHTLFLRKESKLYGCGWNENGQLPTSLVESNLLKVSMLQFTVLEHGEHISKITCGYRHSVFLTSQGKVYVADLTLNNKYRGFSRINNVSDTVVDVDATMNETMTLNKAGKIHLYGKNLPHEILNAQHGVGDYWFLKMSVGRHHSLLLNSNKQVVVLGDPFNCANSEDRIKLDDDIIQEYAKDFPGGCYLHKELFDSEVVDISAGRGHSLILTKNQTLYSFGDNSHGQLGREKTASLLGKVSLDHLHGENFNIQQIGAAAETSFVVISELEDQYTSSQDASLNVTTLDDVTEFNSL